MINKSVATELSVIFWISFRQKFQFTYKYGLSFTLTLLYIKIYKMICNLLHNIYVWTDFGGRVRNLLYFWIKISKSLGLCKLSVYSIWSKYWWGKQQNTNLSRKIGMSYFKALLGKEIENYFCTKIIFHF